MDSASFATQDEPITNRILLALPRGVLDELLPHFKEVDLQTGQVISQLGKVRKEILFINRGMVSLIKTMGDGRSIELGAIGPEGMVGSELLFGIGTPFFESVVQVPGSGISINTSILVASTAKSPAFRALLDRYVHIFADQMAQTAACNRLHFIEQRCCRWLLVAHDSACSDTFPLTQEFLATMLGVNRPGVSLATASLRERGLIHYARGRVTVTDRVGLEKCACECYSAIQSQFDHLLPRERRRASTV